MSRRFYLRSRAWRAFERVEGLWTDKANVCIWECMIVWGQTSRIKFAKRTRVAAWERNRIAESAWESPRAHDWVAESWIVESRTNTQNEAPSQENLAGESGTSDWDIQTIVSEIVHSPELFGSSVASRYNCSCLIENVTSSQPISFRRRAHVTIVHQNGVMWALETRLYHSWLPRKDPTMPHCTFTIRVRYSSLNSRGSSDRMIN